MKRPVGRRCGSELLEARAMLSATAFEYNNIGYFLNQSALRIERYDINGESWLAPVILDGATTAPTAIYADGDGIYAAFNKTLYRYDLNGAHRLHLLNAQDNIIALHSDGNTLFVNHTSGLYARFDSIDKTSNALIDSIENYVDSVAGSSIAPEVNKIFGRSQGVSPSDITYVSYTDAGEFINGGDSPYHGSYPGGSTTWVFPDGAKVVDDSGTIYGTEDLTRLNSFGNHITDIDFSGANVPIVLNGNSLTAYTSSILPTGSKTLTFSPFKIFVNGSDVVTFRVDVTSATGIAAVAVPLATLAAPTPGAPVDPNGLAYSPDAVEVTSDGNLLLFSKTHQSVFLWNTTLQEYTGTIPLVGVPSYTAYSAETNTAYLAYASGLIRKLDLNVPDPVEAPFATLPSSPIGLSTAGRFLFAADSSGPWNTHYTFSPDGALVDSEDWNYFSSEYVWSDANQKMYFFRDDTSPNDVLWEQINANGTAYPNEAPGGIGQKLDSPLHGGEFQHPIRISPDGAYVILGSGMVHDGTTLALRTSVLASGFVDAAWLGSELYTLEYGNNGARIEHLEGSTFAPGATVDTGGQAWRLKTVATNRLVAIVGGAGGIPVFKVYDSALQEVAPSTFLAALTIQPANVTLPESTDTSTAVPVAVIHGTVDGNTITSFSVKGPNAAHFEIIGDSLRLKAGTSLDFEAQSTYSVLVEMNDPTLEVSPAASAWFTLSVSDINESPASVSVTPTVAALMENVNTSSAIELALVSVTDDALGNNHFVLGGPDASQFQLDGNLLKLRAGTSLNFENRARYSVTIAVSDSAASGDMPPAASFELSIGDVNEAPTNLGVADTTTSLPEDTVHTTPFAVARLFYADDALGTNLYSLAGPDASAFEIVGDSLVLKASQSLDFENQPALSVVLSVDDASVGTSPDSSLEFVLHITDVNEAPTQVSIANVVTTLLENADTTLALKLGDIQVQDDALGVNSFSLTGPDASLMQIVGNELQLRPGTRLDVRLKSSFLTYLHANDATIAGANDTYATIAIAITPDSQNAPPLVGLVDRVASITSSQDLSGGLRVATIVIIDDGLGVNSLGLHGPDAAHFDIVDGQLRLNADTLLNPAQKALYRVEVVVDDAATGASPDAAAYFELAITSTLWHNDQMPADVSGNGRIEAHDVLLVVNELNTAGSHILSAYSAGSAMLDVNGDNLVSAADVVRIVNWLNSNESTPPASASALPALVLAGNSLSTVNDYPVTMASDEPGGTQIRQDAAAPPANTFDAIVPSPRGRFTRATAANAAPVDRALCDDTDWLDLF